MQQVERALGRSVIISEAEKTKILESIHNMVRNGTLGLDYTISNRDKNRRLRRDYNITDAKIRQILLDLHADNFIKAEKSDNLDHPNDVVYIFKKKTLLMPRWQENADDVNVRLYIKITWPAENTMMFIISFHEDNI